MVVEADPPPFAVPAAVVGEPLGSLPTPPGDGIVGAALAFDPETVLPGQRSRATVDYTATDAAASGSTVTLSIAEELQLLDGTTRTEPPYRADLVVYRTEEGARSRFFLASSEAARLLPIELGEENVAVLPYGGEIVRGNVLGPQGGSVLDTVRRPDRRSRRRPRAPDAGAARAGRRGNPAAAGTTRVRLRRRAAARSLRRNAPRTGDPLPRSRRAAVRRGDRDSLRHRVAHGRRLHLATARDDHAVRLRLAERHDRPLRISPGRE